MESTSTISANLIQGALRLKDNQKAIGPLRPAQSSDAKTLENIARSISQGITSSRQLLLTTGFGLNRSGKIPVRLPVLAIPGFNAMERMQDAGLPVPKYLLYQATEFIAETNCLSQDESVECSRKMEKYLRQYVERFHARIAEHVVFRFGCEYPPEIKNIVTDTAEEIKSLLKDLPPLREAMEKIDEGEKRHSNGVNNSHTYAAANVFYSGAIESYPFMHDLPVDTQAILPIGGNAEKPFFNLTAHFSAHVGKRKVIPMLTPLGSRPTYYYYPQSEDPASISEYANAVKQPLKDGPIRIDINALQADGATPDMLSDIYPEQQ
jgi:hypothetical protein